MNFGNFGKNGVRIFFGRRGVVAWGLGCAGEREGVEKAAGANGREREDGPAGAGSECVGSPIMNRRVAFRRVDWQEKRGAVLERFHFFGFESVGVATPGGR
jgi:hypothetical protein